MHEKSNSMEKAHGYNHQQLQQRRVMFTERVNKDKHCLLCTSPNIYIHSETLTIPTDYLEDKERRRNWIP